MLTTNWALVILNIEGNMKIRVGRLLAAIANCFKANVYFEMKKDDPYLRAVRSEMKAEQ